METSCRAKVRVSLFEAGVGSGSARFSQMVASPLCSTSGGLAGAAVARSRTHFFVTVGLVAGPLQLPPAGAGVDAGDATRTARAGADAGAGCGAAVGCAVGSFAAGGGARSVSR